MTSTGHASRTSGFTLTEILFVLAMLGLAFLMEAQLFSASMRVISTSPAAEAQQARLREMLDVMRRDVWGSASIEQPDPNTILLTKAGGTMIRWKIVVNNVTRSVEAANSLSQEKRWEISLPLEAQGQGPMLVLKSTAKVDASSERRFISQLLIAQTQETK